MSQTVRLYLPAILAFALLVSVLLGLDIQTVTAVSSIEQQSALNGPLCVVREGGGPYAGCTQVYTRVQDAVDAALPGATVKVAQGVYTDVDTRSAPTGTPVTQVVYLSKTLLLQGGYTVTDWITPSFMTHRTIINTQHRGRGIFVTGDVSPTIEGLWIMDGEAGRGGGLYALQATVALRENIITANEATYGAGLYIEDSAVELVSNTVSANHALCSGGGMALAGGTATLAGNWIGSNVAAGEQSCNGEGGGILNWSAALTLTRNTVVSNAAQYWGGGLCGYADALVGNAILSNTVGSYGGGVTSWGIGRIAGNRFAHNTAGLEGGGFWGNVDDIDSNTFSQNTAERGGGLYLLGPSRVANNVVAENHADHIGSGLYIYGSRVDLLHNTLDHNTGGDGSGVHVAYSGTVALTNTIVTHHTVGITVASGSTVSLAANLWGAGPWANEFDWSGAGTILTGTKNVWGDPAFVDPAAGDYHLTVGSSARDRGLSTGVSLDIDAQARPIGSGYDIGADELLYYPTYLPLVERGGP